MVEAATARGHEVTLFNRNQRPGVFPDLETLVGDRDGDLKALQGRAWDAVIDTCGYIPRIVRASAELLAEAAHHYTFISTVSVYANPDRPGTDETAPLARLVDPLEERITGETYGPLKAACERVVREIYGQRALCVRPGLFVGPHDPTDRFTYWPHRVARGGIVLAPGRPEREVQFIDARDLADWVLRMIERRQAGTYNTCGPARPLTMLAFLEACRSVCGSDARFVWLDDAFLVARGVQAYTEAPLWIPAVHDTIASARALEAGLVFRLLEETLQDTLEWDSARPAETALHAGFTPRRERELLEAWSAASGGPRQKNLDRAAVTGDA